jgi:hypothetical protein
VKRFLENPATTELCKIIAVYPIQLLAAGRSICVYFSIAGEDLDGGSEKLV